MIISNKKKRRVCRCGQKLKLNESLYLVGTEFVCLKCYFISLNKND